MKAKVLFLCTGNCCRSQMAEALLRQLDPEAFEALSAGSHPAGYVHPLVLAACEKWNVPLIDQRSKSWDEFTDTPIDVVVTLCDAAADETCPVWRGAPLQAHWPLPDPSFHPGDEAEQMAHALTVFERLRVKIAHLVQLDFQSTARTELQAELDRIAAL